MSLMELFKNYSQNEKGNGGNDSNLAIVTATDHATQGGNGGNGGNGENVITEVKNNLIITCYTPNGKPIEVEARDQDHAAWLLKMNPKPHARGAVLHIRL